jgi:hypothetical protein
VRDWHGIARAVGRYQAPTPLWPAPRPELRAARRAVPADVIGAANMVAKIATGEVADEIEPKNESAAADFGTSKVGPSTISRRVELAVNLIYAAATPDDIALVARPSALSSPHYQSRGPSARAESSGKHQPPRTTASRAVVAPLFLFTGMTSVGSQGRAGGISGA